MSESSSKTPGIRFKRSRWKAISIAADPLKLLDEANSIGMFGGARRAIRVDVGGKSVIPALEPLLKAPPPDCIIILEAGPLKRDAPLRRLVEADPLGVSIECNLDSFKDVLRLIDDEVRAAGLSIEPAAREILAHSLGEDRLSNSLGTRQTHALCAWRGRNRRISCRGDHGRCGRAGRR